MILIIKHINDNKLNQSNNIRLTYTLNKVITFKSHVLETK